MCNVKRKYTNELWYVNLEIPVQLRHFPKGVWNFVASEKIHLPHICKYLTSNFVIDHLEVCYLRTFQNFLVVLMLHLLGVGWLDLSKLQRSKFGLQTWFVNTLYKYSKNLLLQIFNFPALWHAGLKFPFLNEKHFTTDWQGK